MKKIFALLSAFALCLTLTSCAENEDVIDPDKDIEVVEQMNSVEVLATLFEEAGFELFDQTTILNKETATNAVNFAPMGQSTDPIVLDNFASGVQAKPAMMLATNLAVILELTDDTNIEAVKEGLLNMQYSGVCVMPKEGTVHTAVNGNYVAYFVNIEQYMPVVTGTAEGRNGEITVNVTLNNGNISNIQIDHVETESYFEAVQNELVNNIIMNNGTDGVDAISGSTISSEAVIEAVNNALNVELVEPEGLITETGDFGIQYFDHGATLASAFESMDMSKSEVNTSGAIGEVIEKYSSLDSEVQAEISSISTPWNIEGDLGQYASIEGFDYAQIDSIYAMASEFDYSLENPSNEYIHYVVETTNTEAVKQMLDAAAIAGTIGMYFFSDATVTVDGNLVILSNIK